jgi:hypothetical protein
MVRRKGRGGERKEGNESMEGKREKVEESRRPTIVLR